MTVDHQARVRGPMVKRHRYRVLLVALFAVCAAFLMHSSARADEFGLVPGTFRADALMADGVTAETQAGAHPYQATTTFEVRGGDDPGGSVSGFIRDLDISLPPGFIGNPETTPKCSREQFGNLVAERGTCPPGSQVGVASIEYIDGTGTPARQFAPVFNVVPQPGDTADFGMPVISVPVHVVASVNTSGDYGLRVKIDRLSQGLPLLRTSFTLWGVPADPSHDALRTCGTSSEPMPWTPPCPTNAERRAFLTNPSECGGPSTSSIAVASWREPGVWKSDSYTPEARIQGCDRLRFEPRITVRSDSQRAGVPAGYSVDIDLPFNDDPDGIAYPPIKDASVTMPAETWISPSSADGLQGCTDAQIAIGSDVEPSCPEQSKIGTVTVRTPLLADPMQGEVYLGQPLRGNLFRLFLTLRGPGLLIKLPGIVRPKNVPESDPQWGMVTATFLRNPPIPFTNLHLQFKGGPRAPLSNPSVCGPATTTAAINAWGVDTPAQLSSSFNITQKADGSPCGPKGFSPELRAGLVNPVAGKAGTFSLAFSRTDQDQFFRGVSVDMPEGLTGMLSSVTECADAAASAGTCGEASRIGSAVNAAGPGSNPFYLPGRVYLTGPYKGAPIGLSIVVPAVAGPFDLGTVVVRQAVFVDRSNAKLRVVSDPLPTILEGVPLQIRSVQVKIDKPGFMLAPTNCRAQSIGAQLMSITGAVANTSTRFQVGNCASLPFAPRMSLKVGARGKLTRGKRTPLEVRLTMPRGHANNRSVQVILPKTLNARLDVVDRRRACSIEQFRADRCPMVVGQGTAVTPLLRDPLRGPAYFVYNPDRRLPDLVVRLKGQIDIDLVGKVRITRDLRLQTTFDAVPDQPISSFRLRLESGPRNGPIGIVRNLCAKSTRKVLAAELDFTAQSNKKVSRDQKISVAGCGRTATRGRARARGRNRRASRRSNGGRRTRR